MGGKICIQFSAAFIPQGVSPIYIFVKVGIGFFRNYFSEILTLETGRTWEKQCIEFSIA